MRLVLVEWVDSVALGETWVDNEVIRGLDVCHCVSIGVEMQGDLDKVVLCQSVGTGKNNGNNLIAIPRGCIKRMRDLKIERVL